MGLDKIRRFSKSFSRTVAINQLLMLFTKQMLVLFDLMSSGSVLVMRSVRLFVICCVDYDGNCH